MQELRTFSSEMKSCRIELYEPYVVAFCVALQQKLDQGADVHEVIHTIQEQRLEIQRLEKGLLHVEIEFIKQVNPLSMELIAPDLAAHVELSRQIRTFMHQTLPEDIFPKGILNESISYEIIKKTELFYAKQLQSIKAIVDQGKKTRQMEEEIKAFCQQYSTTLSSFQCYADLREQLSRLTTVLFSLEKIESLEERYARMNSIKQEAPASIQELHSHAKQLEKSCQNMQSALKRRLLEIFTAYTPFPDLKEQLVALRGRLTQEMVNAEEAFFQGRMSIHEYQERLQSLPYEHDVALSRGELAFRGTRLAELRQECHRQLKRIQPWHYYLLLCASEDNLQQEITALMHALFLFLLELENPFSIFAHSIAFESVNETFRSLWIRMEAFEPKVTACTQVAACTLIPEMQRQHIQRSLFRAVDDLEEVLQEIQYVRPNLANPLKIALSSTNADTFAHELLLQITELEKQYPFTQPFAFFLPIDSSQQRRQLLVAAKEHYDAIEKTKKYCKILQYCKTFEEERIDAILEAFEKQGIIEEKPAPLQHIIDLVEEEILFDIGLISSKDLIDVDENRLINACREAYNSAIQHAQHALHQLESVDSHSIIAHLKTECANEITTLISEDKKQDMESLDILTKLTSLCALLFRAKILTSASTNIPRVTLALQYYVNTLENMLEESKKEEIFFNRSWTPGIHALRTLITKTASIQEDRDAYTIAVNTILAKSDAMIAQNTLSAENLAQKKAFQNEIRELVANVLAHKSEEPLHFIPGCLTYFSSCALSR